MSAVCAENSVMGQAKNKLKEMFKEQHNEDVLNCTTTTLFKFTHLGGQERVARSTDGEVTVAALWKLRKTVNI